MAKRFVLALLCAISLAAGFVTPIQAVMPVPPKPANGWYVLDQTQTLRDDEIDKLNAQIDGYRKKPGVQFAVLIVPTITKDDYLERFSLNVAREWGVGEKSKNNGALLLVAKDDRKMRIEVGSGLEGDLTDARASQIIRDRIAPEFRKGNYYEGINVGLQGMALAVESQADPQLGNEDTTEENDRGSLILFGLFMLYSGLSWLAAVLGRSKRWWPGGIVGAVIGGVIAFILIGLIWAIAIGSLGMILGFLFDYFVSKEYRKAKELGRSPAWWAGGSVGSGSSGSSGGGGFGGGGFSGGGSSGSW